MDEDQKAGLRKYLPKPGFSMEVADSNTYGLIVRLLVSIGFSGAVGTGDLLQFDPRYTRVYIDTENLVVTRAIGLHDPSLSLNKLLEVLEKATDEEMAKEAQFEAARAAALKFSNRLIRPKI